MNTLGKIAMTKEVLWTWIKNKLNNHENRITNLESSGGPPPGSSIALAGDVNGNSDNNLITYIGGMPLDNTLTQAGSIWTYDANNGVIKPIDAPTSDNMILSSDSSLGVGMLFKTLNFAPNPWIKSGIFTNYVMQVGYHFYQLNFGSIAGPVNLEFPPLEAGVMPIIVQLLKSPAFDVTFTCATANAFSGELKMDSNIQVMNFIAYPDFKSGIWIIVTMLKK